MDFKSPNFAFLKKVLICTSLWNFVLMIPYTMLTQKHNPENMRYVPLA